MKRSEDHDERDRAPMRGERARDGAGDGAGAVVGGGVAPPPSAQVSLGDGWTAGLSAVAGGALLRVGGGPSGGTMEIVIALTSEGPVLRARAAALEVIADKDIVARCESFRVEARKDVSFTAGETLRTEGRRVEVEATHGSVNVEANDNVKLLGENILLNCDAPAPAIPPWARALASLPQPELAVAQASGDAGLVAELAAEMATAAAERGASE